MSVLRRDYLLKCIHLWHTGPTNSHLSLMFMEEMLNNAMYAQKIVSTRSATIPDKRKVIYCSSLIMPTYIMPVLFNMLCKMFINFSGWYSCQTRLPTPLNIYGTWWEDVWLILLAHLVLCQQVQDAWNDVWQNSIHDLYDCINTCVNVQGGWPKWARWLKFNKMGSNPHPNHYMSPLGEGPCH